MIAVIDYDAGNIGSVKNALTTLGVPHMVTKDASLLSTAAGVILPGVGAAGEGMKNIRKYKMDTAIKEITKQQKPFLGICLGMQLLFSTSEEGNVSCLDVCKGTVLRFSGIQKVPHMGWNQVSVKQSALFAGIPNNSFFYFVHSYYCKPAEDSITSGVTEYGLPFTSAIEIGNLAAVQFHPEKSGDAGLQLLRNFTEKVYDHHSRN